MARTAEKQAEHFMAKWIAAERKPGLDYGMQLYARTSREGPRRGQPKASGLVLVRSPLLTIATSGTNLYPPGVWFADAVTSCFGVSLRMVFFYLVTTVWIFYMSLCENSTKKSIKKSRACLRERNFLLFSFMNGNLLNI